MDLCPGCADGTINLSRSAFDKIVGSGPAGVTYWREINPPLPGPIELRVGTTDGDRVALQVINTGNPLRSVAIQPSATPAPTTSPSTSVSPGATASPSTGGATSWQELSPNANDFWVASGPLTAARFTVRITDDQGHRVLIPRVALAPGAQTHTRSLMYQAAATPSPASTAAAQPALAPTARAASPATHRTSVAGQDAGC